jgi:hypothetical protein
MKNPLKSWLRISAWKRLPFDDKKASKHIEDIKRANSKKPAELNDGMRDGRKIKT